MNFKLIAPMMAISFAAVSQAQVVFSEDFDIDNSANWSFFSSISGDGANDNSGNEANFFFDYSTVGIASAPNSVGGSTTGLKMNANLDFGTLSGVSVSPNGQSFSGDYTVRFDAWLNSVGPFPGGGSGSTQLTMAGVGGINGLNWHAAANHQATSFGATGDGGSSFDYRAYIDNTSNPGEVVPVSSGAYAAGSMNASDVYYTSRYQGAVPAAQLGLYSQQTGAPQPGAAGFAWHQWEIVKTGDVITWSQDGSLIATVTNANMVGSNIFFGQSDINNSFSSSPDSQALIFGLIDNVQVEAVPEPATMTILAGLAGLAALKRRKK